MGNRSILNSALYRYLRFGTIIFITNTYFLLTCLPFIIVFISVPTSTEFILFYGLSLIPSSLGFQALLSTMMMLKRDQDIPITRKFFLSLAENWRQSLLLGLVFIPILTIFCVDFLYYFQSGKFLMVLFFACLTILGVSLYVIEMAILARFEITTKNLFKIGIYAVITHPLRSLSSLGALGILLAALLVIPSVSILCVFALVTYILVLNLTPLLTVLEKELQVTADEK